MLQLLEDTPGSSHGDGEDDQGMREGFFIQSKLQKVSVAGIAVQNPHAQAGVIWKVIRFWDFVCNIFNCMRSVTFTENGDAREVNFQCAFQRFYIKLCFPLQLKSVYLSNISLIDKLYCYL